MLALPGISHRFLPEFNASKLFRLSSAPAPPTTQVMVKMTSEPMLREQVGLAKEKTAEESTTPPCHLGPDIHGQKRGWREEKEKNNSAGDSGQVMWFHLHHSKCGSTVDYSSTRNLSTKSLLWSK